MITRVFFYSWFLRSCESRKVILRFAIENFLLVKVVDVGNFHAGWELEKVVENRGFLRVRRCFASRALISS